MLNFNEFIESKNLTSRQRVVLITEYELLEKTGAIGDSELRTLANEWSDHIGIYVSVSETMKAIAFNCYRYFTYKFLKERMYEII
jgi:hypothetical protein